MFSIGSCPTGPAHPHPKPTGTNAQGASIWSFSVETLGVAIRSGTGRMHSMSTPAARRPRALSGAQPTADSYHLGNYIGAFSQWVALQEEFEAFYFIPDMH